MDSLNAPLILNRNYCRFWTGNTFSWIGDQFYLVALLWLILQITDSSLVLGTITMLGSVPRAAFILIGGELSDRMSPRKIMIAAACIRAVLVTILTMLIGIGSVQIWHLYLLAFAFGIADAFAAPAGQAYLPAIVAPEGLPAANSMLQSAAQVTVLVAPAPVGVFIEAFGTAWALFIDAVSFLFVVAALWTLPDPLKPRPLSTELSMFRSILAGLKYIRRDSALSALLLVISALNFAVSGPLSIGIAYIAKQKYGTPSSFGFLMSTLAAGALLGTLLSGVARYRKRGRLLILITLAIGLCLVGIGMADGLPFLAATLLLTSSLAAFANVQLMAWLQQRTDKAMMGRVMSVVMFCSVGLVPFSMAAAGLTIQWSIQGMFVVAGTLVVAVICGAAFHRQVREID